MKRSSAAAILSLLFGALLPDRARSEENPFLDDVSEVTEKAIAEHGAPGLAVAAIVDGKVRAAGCAGVRKRGDQALGKIELTDRFHFGSLTKSFTATLAASMVEEGRIRWTTKPSEVLRGSKIHPGFRDLTLEHLLSNCGGFPTDVPPPIWRKAWAARGNLKAIRLDFAREMLAREPLFAPGSEYLYSNTGFSIAGAMLESRMSDPWETLIRKRIFEPLDMRGSGFRAPAADPFDPTKQRAQPWGHKENGTPVPPEPFGENPYAIAPASAIHGPILDLAKYARYHLLEKPAPVLVHKRSVETLHTPRRNDYALGWLVVKRAWSGDTRILHHDGTNTMFYAVMWVVPAKNFAVVAAANIGGARGAGACEDAVWAMVRRYVLR